MRNFPTVRGWFILLTRESLHRISHCVLYSKDIKKALCNLGHETEFKKLSSWDDEDGRADL